jgi:TRAP-type C4-dicarboxylate transport system substrate-binding protein
MKKSRIVLGLVLIISVFVALAVPGGNACAQKKPIVLRLVVPTPEGDWPMTFMTKEMAKRFNERAAGSYLIEVHAGGSLAKLPEYFDAVRIGAVEMAYSPWGTFANLDARLGLLELPFLFTNNRSANEASKALLPLFDRVLQEKFNAKGLGMMNNGGMGLWSFKPINTLADLKGLLVASVSPSASSLLKGLGTAPVTIMFPDMYESVQKKIVEGAFLGLHAGLTFSLNDACKQYTAFFGMPAIAGYSLNLDVWKKMPPAIRQILKEETDKAALFLGDVLLTKIPEMDLKSSKEKDFTVSILPAEERARWAKLFQPYIEKQLSSYGDLGRQMKKICEDTNKKYPYQTNKDVL